MQVEPAKLVELAAASESTLTAMKKDWADALDELSAACTALGDATGTTNVVSSYTDSLADAGEVVTAIAETWGSGSPASSTPRRTPYALTTRLPPSSTGRPTTWRPSPSAGRCRDRAVADVPANSWELRADVVPLNAAAARWSELAGLMTRRGDDIVDAARRATEGWDAAAAESYDHHRRQVLANLDRFTTLASSISGSLRAISSIITSSQKELDQAWTKVAMIPHDVVGESRYLVFHPTEDEDKGKVTQGQQETDEIRRRLTMSLDQESSRLRSARAELVSVRTELKTLAGGVFPGLLVPGVVEATSGVGMVPSSSSSSTSVPGSAQAGISALPPIAASMPVSMPDLTGISTGLAPIAGAAASGILGRGAARRDSAVTPPMGGAGGMGMGARAGTMSRGMASGRAGGRRMATPKLENTPTEDAAARAAREKESAKEAKRAALEEKRAERAARKAERKREDDDESPVSVRVEGDDDLDDLDDQEDEADGQAPVTVRIEDFDSDDIDRGDTPDVGRDADAGGKGGLRPA